MELVTLTVTETAEVGETFTLPITYAAVEITDPSTSQTNCTLFNYIYVVLGQCVDSSVDGILFFYLVINAK